MTLSISVFSQLDTNEERREALAKVYSLLIRLADDVEKTTKPSESEPIVEKIENPISSEVSTSEKIRVYQDPEILNPDKDLITDLVPLQNNIPS